MNVKKRMHFACQSETFRLKRSKRTGYKAQRNIVIYMLMTVMPDGGDIPSQPQAKRSPAEPLH